MYDFVEQLEIGEAHERTLDAFFQQWYDIFNATWDEQQHGIDRVFVDRRSRELIPVEYKADEKSGETGNVFIETVSVDAVNKAGWALTSQARWLFYYLPTYKLICFYEMAALRLHLERWAITYPQGKAQNKGYCSVGILVPVYEFQKQARRIVPVP